jgi:hypothetical protein
VRDLGGKLDGGVGDRGNHWAVPFTERKSMKGSYDDRLSDQIVKIN